MTWRTRWKDPQKNGRDGLDAPPADPGRDGRDGADGIGKDGRDGMNGRDAVPQVGKDGERGPRGIQGEEGPPGPAPAHRWDGTELQFERPDGTWGKKVDLQGPPGAAGFSGVVSTSSTGNSYFPAGW